MTDRRHVVGQIVGQESEAFHRPRRSLGRSRNGNAKCVSVSLHDAAVGLQLLQIWGARVVVEICPKVGGI